MLEIEDRPPVCDAEIWNFLTQTEAGYALGWGKTFEAQAKLLLDTDALFFAAESRGETVDDKSTPTVSKLIRLEVLSKLENTDDYRDLAALLFARSSDSAWTNSSEGLAVSTQLKSWREDAESTAVIEENGERIFCYAVDGRVMHDVGINASDLFNSRAYRSTIADELASNLVAFSFNEQAKRALAAYRAQRSSDVQ